MSEERNTRKVRQGVVVSAANDKTIVVSVADVNGAGVVAVASAVVSASCAPQALKKSRHAKAASALFHRCICIPLFLIQEQFTTPRRVCQS